jgi:hypothetical protein
MFKQGYFDGNKPLTFTNLDHLQQQAKEMEREQIENAYNESFRLRDKPYSTAKNYYKQTYGGNK